jgi:hypothetical protein
VALTYAAGQQLRQVWNATWTPADTTPATVRNAPWNGSIAPGGSRTFGLLGTWQGTNPAPAATCGSP